MFLFYWLIGIMPLDNHPFWGREIIGTFTLVKALGLICTCVAIQRLISTGRNPHLFRTPQARWLAAFAFVECTSYFTHFGQIENVAWAYSHVFSICSLFFVGIVLMDSEVRLQRALLVAVGAVGFSSLYTIRQQQKFGDLYGFRPGGLLGDANEYALVVGLWMPLAFIWMANKNRPKWERALCAACLLATFLGTTFASSRGGFLGLVAAFLYLVLRSRTPMKNLAIVSTIALPMLILSPSSPIRRFKEPNYGDKVAEHARIIAWTAGVRMVQAHPIIGVGLHNFKFVVEQYEPGDKVISVAHNTYIELAAELGLPGVVCFVGVLFAALHRLEKIRQKTVRRGLLDLANLALGMQAGLISYMISCMFMSAWWQKLLWMLIVCTSALDAISRLRLRQRKVAIERRRAATWRSTSQPATVLSEPSSPDRFVSPDLSNRAESVR